MIIIEAAERFGLAQLHQLPAASVEETSLVTAFFLPLRKKLKLSA